MNAEERVHKAAERLRQADWTDWNIPTWLEHVARIALSDALQEIEQLRGMVEDLHRVGFVHREHVQGCDFCAAGGSHER